MKRLVIAPDSRTWKKRVNAAFVLCVTAGVVSLPAQTFKTLHSFDGTDGANSRTGLVQGISGSLYGTTSLGGANSDGTVFKITAGGKLTSLYSFCSQTNCIDGVSPYAGLVQATNGNIYGTTYGGGSGAGTVFKITSGGELTTLYPFCCANGISPDGTLVQAANGDFYGTTNEGGANTGGTVFKITPSGELTTLHNFCSKVVASQCADGSNPQAALIQATDGDFYGTTVSGGINGNGTIFRITPGGKLTTLHNFCSQSECADGSGPAAPLVQATDGDFYGTTSANGGNANNGGTVFRINSSGMLATLYSFCAQISEGTCTDGQSPNGLIQATDGNFYGTTANGGAMLSNAGSVFQITPNGTLTTLYTFCENTPCTDGEGPLAGLVQDTDGTFYGTTFNGGANGYGTVFALSVGLGSFVETRPTIGVVSEVVAILGYGLTGATSVTFNGTPATILYDVSTVIYAKVPTGATTGKVQVVTTSGTLTSNLSFLVAP